MDKYFTLKYWASIVGCIVLGAYLLFAAVVFLMGYYSDHETPWSRLKKWLKSKRGKHG